jgi:hypothetical protein
MCGSALMLDKLIAILPEHEQADRRRQIAVLPIAIDRRDKVGQGQVALVRDLLEPLPERILKADTRLVASDDDRPLYDWRFHGFPSPRTQRNTERPGNVHLGTQLWPVIEPCNVLLRSMRQRQNMEKSVRPQGNTIAVTTAVVLECLHLKDS